MSSAKQKDICGKLTTFDPAEDLPSHEAIALFMEEASKTGDDAYIKHALEIIAQAQNKRQSTDPIRPDEVPPLELQAPNAETSAAMDEARSTMRAKLARFTTPGALFAAIEPKT